MMFRSTAEAPLVRAAEPAAIDLMGLPVHALDMAATVAHVMDALRRGERVQHCAINVAKLVKMLSDPELAADVFASNLRNADGMGIVLAARLLGRPLPERVTGVDLMEALCAACARDRVPVFVLGAQAGVLDRAIAVLQDRHPGLVVAGRQHGYFDAAKEEGIVDAINASGARCLFVAMPTPRKERFIARHRDRLAPELLMGVGGTIDVVSGKVDRAPAWMQRAGLEWFHRLVREPRKMFWRYTSTNTAFAWLMLRALAGRVAGRPYAPLAHGRT